MKNYNIILSNKDNEKLLKKYDYVQSLVKDPENIYSENYETIEDFIAHIISAYLRDYCYM